MICKLTDGKESYIVEFQHRKNITKKAEDLAQDYIIFKMLNEEPEKATSYRLKKIRKMKLEHFNNDSGENVILVD